VTLGRASVSTVEVRDGLQPGEQVILSDTSAWDASEIRVHGSTDVTRAFPDASRETFGGDARLALRRAREAAGVLYAVVVLTIALGIARTPRSFSLMDQVLLRPLPVRRCPGGWWSSTRLAPSRATPRPTRR
jgi:hypothetical protein